MKKQKTIILILLIAFFSNINIAKSQDYYYAVYDGDTIDLSVNNANGTIQWQQTDDTLDFWTNISSATDSAYTHISEVSASGFKYYRAEITNLATCAVSWYSPIIKHRIITSTSDVQLTDWYKGGLVFYIDGAGNGLIAAPSDQSAGAEWGCYEALISGADSTAIGTGEQNTSDIIAGCSTTGIAAYICDTLRNCFEFI